MIKKLIKHGNSMALVIDRAIMDLLKIKPDTPLEITTDGHVLIATPIHDEKRRKEYEQSLKPENRKYRYGIILKDNEDDVELLVNGISKGKVDKASIVTFFKNKLKPRTK